MCIQDIPDAKQAVSNNSLKVIRLVSVECEIKEEVYRTDIFKEQINNPYVGFRSLFVSLVDVNGCK